MEIKEAKFKVKCDVAGCRNYGMVYIENKGFLLDKSIYLCEDCVRQIYEWYAKRITPPSIYNMLNKKGLIDDKPKRKKRGE